VHDPLDLVRLEVLLGVLFQVQHDLGAAGDARDLLGRCRRDLEAGAALGAPRPGLARAGAL